MFVSFIGLPTICPSIYLSIFLSFHLSVHPSVHPSILSNNEFVTKWPYPYSPQADDERLPLPPAGRGSVVSPREGHIRQNHRRPGEGVGKAVCQAPTVSACLSCSLSDTHNASHTHNASLTMSSRDHVHSV